MPVKKRGYENFVILTVLISFFKIKKKNKNTSPRPSLANVIVLPVNEIFLTKMPIAPVSMTDIIAAAYPIIFVFSIFIANLALNCFILASAQADLTPQSTALFLLPFQ